MVKEPIRACTSTKVGCEGKWMENDTKRVEVKFLVYISNASFHIR